jgi:hypothetical protein
MKQNYVMAKLMPLVLVRTREELERLRSMINEGHRIESVEPIFAGHRVILSKLNEGEREVWGESFDDYARRVFTGI